MMSHTTRWFLLHLNASEPGAKPGGLARRVLDVEGHALAEEAVQADLRWHPTDFFRRQKLGHLDWDLVEVDEAGAQEFLSELRMRLGS